MLEILSRCKLLEYKFGFLGEIYVEEEVLHQLNADMLEKYFSWKEPYFCSRNCHYYRSDFNITMSYVFEYQDDINEIIQLNMSESHKRCVLICIVGHLLNDIAKLMGAVFSNKRYHNKYFRPLKDLLQLISDYYINLIFSRETTELNYISKEFFGHMANDVEKLGGLDIREYSEMDHPLILIISYFAYYEYLKDISLFIAPLQGASLIPPIYVSLAKLFNKEKQSNHIMKIEYLRYSNYDSSHRIDISIDEQIEEICKFNDSVHVMLVDDNVGTGRTIEKLIAPLRKKFDKVSSGVLECRWDTKIYDLDYPAFDINSIDIITPVQYRHYGVFGEEIAYIRLCDKLSTKYREGFYNLDLIYNDCDFEDYIEKSNIKRDNKNRLLEIVMKYKMILKNCMTVHDHLSS